ncbi:MAG: MATE family efflux transporter [Alphaproteobacteria bacterium]|nr:MATE family efflux transporter [Alphaproteobacteria bacterium]
MALSLGHHLVELLRLSAPVIVARTGIMAMSIVDVAFLGRAGADQVAFMAIAGVGIGTMIVGSIGLMVGTMVETSHALGAGRERECGQVWRRSLLYALVAGVAGAVLCLFGEPLFRLTGQAPDIASGAARVLTILGLCLPGTTLFVTTTFFLEAIKRPLPGMITILLANLLNAFLNWVFVPGNLGLPAMGAEGSALATGITRLVMAAMLIGYVLVMPDHARFAVRERPPGGWRAGAKARQMGYATGASYALEAAAFGSMSVYAGWLGVRDLAAWSIALNAMSFVFMIAVGLGVGTAVRVGHARGRGDRSEMAVAGWVGLGATAAAMGLASLGFLFFATPLARLFTDEPALLALAAATLVMGSWVMVVDGGQGMMLSAVRATGDTWVPTAMHFTAYFGVMIPLAWALAFPLRLGTAGLFLAILAASVIAVLLLSWRFHRRCAVA